MIISFADEFKKGAPKDIEELVAAYPDDISNAHCVYPVVNILISHSFMPGRTLLD